MFPFSLNCSRRIGEIEERKYYHLAELIVNHLLGIPSQDREEISVKWGHYVLGKILRSGSGPNSQGSQSASSQSSGSGSESGMQSGSDSNWSRPMAPPSSCMEVTHTTNFIGAIVEKIKRVPESDKREKILDDATMQFFTIKKAVQKKRSQTGSVMVNTWLMDCERASLD